MKDEAGAIPPSNPAAPPPSMQEPRRARRRWGGVAVAVIIGALMIGGTAVWVHRIQTAAPGQLVP